MTSARTTRRDGGSGNRGSIRRIGPGRGHEPAPRRCLANRAPGCGGPSGPRRGPQPGLGARSSRGGDRHPVASAFEAALERRTAGEPIAYIRGFKEWHSLQIRTDRRALIPRPETELLADAAIAEIAGRLARDDAPFVVWEVGSGSGAVAVAIALHHRAALGDGRVTLIASDASADALELAAENLAAHGVESIVTTAFADLLGPAGGLLHDPTSSSPTFPTSRPPRSTRVTDRSGTSRASPSMAGGTASICYAGSSPTCRRGPPPARPCCWRSAKVSGGTSRRSPLRAHRSSSCRTWRASTESFELISRADS